MIMMVGNKLDLQADRTVEYDEAYKFAQQNNIMYIETSAKDNTNVDKAFESLFDQIYRYQFY